MRSCAPWTKAEVKRLRKLWVTAPMTEILAHLKSRTECAIRLKAQTFGVTRPQRHVGPVTHGHFIGGRASPTYASWSKMIERCLKHDSLNYESYGGRGIRVCKRWLKFKNFLADMGTRPEGKFSLDRIDNDGNYEPGNCRWATDSEQQRNKRSNRILTFRGKTKLLIEWADEIGIRGATLAARIKRSGSISESLTMPFNLGRAHANAPA